METNVLWVPINRKPFRKERLRAKSHLQPLDNQENSLKEGAHSRGSAPPPISHPQPDTVSSRGSNIKKTLLPGRTLRKTKTDNLSDTSGFSSESDSSPMSHALEKSKISNVKSVRSKKWLPKSNRKKDENKQKDAERSFMSNSGFSTTLPPSESGPSLIGTSFAPDTPRQFPETPAVAQQSPNTRKPSTKARLLKELGSDIPGFQVKLTDDQLYSEEKLLRSSSGIKKTRRRRSTPSYNNYRKSSPKKIPKRPKKKVKPRTPKQKQTRNSIKTPRSPDMFQLKKVDITKALEATNHLDISGFDSSFSEVSPGKSETEANSLANQVDPAAGFDSPIELPEDAGHAEKSDKEESDKSKGVFEESQDISGDIEGSFMKTVAHGKEKGDFSESFGEIGGVAGDDEVSAVKSSITLYSPVQSPHINVRMRSSSSVTSKTSKASENSTKSTNSANKSSQRFPKNGKSIRTPKSGRNLKSRDSHISLVSTKSNRTDFTQETIDMFSELGSPFSANSSPVETKNTPNSKKRKKKLQEPLELEQESGTEEQDGNSKALVEYSNASSPKFEKFIREGMEKLIPPLKSKTPTPHRRRSKRRKWRPLSYWKGERVLYTKNHATDIEIQGAAKTKLCKTPTPAKLRSSRSKSRAIIPLELSEEVEISVTQAEFGKFEIFDSTGTESKLVEIQKLRRKNEGTKKWRKYFVKDVDNWEEILEEYPPVDLSIKEAVKNPCEVQAGSISQISKNKSEISGKIKLKARTMKLMEDTGTMTYTMTVESCQPNALMFNVSGKQMIVHSGMVVKLPSDIVYGFENISHKYEALISFKISEM